MARTAKVQSAGKRPRRRPTGRTTATGRKKFLETLALSANVTAAAKKAKLTTTAVYRQRAKDPGFRALWHAALCEGYARLETELLAEALAEAEPGLEDAVVKARQYKQRLALALLAAHRAAVRGERAVSVKMCADDSKGAKLELGATIAAMAGRLTAPGTADSRADSA